MFYAYNAFLRFSDFVEHEDDCPAGCELTDQEPPETPWPDGTWPFFIEGQWELLEVQQKLTV